MSIAMACLSPLHSRCTHHQLQSLFPTYEKKKCVESAHATDTKDKQDYLGADLLHVDLPHEGSAVKADIFAPVFWYIVCVD